MIGTEVQRAAELLRCGELVAIPTETVYGLAGNAFDEKAVARIFVVKNRPTFDPLIVHTSDWERLMALVSFVPESAQRLAQAFMPGPLTLLLPKKNCIPDLVTAGSPLVALRIPQHPLTLALLQQLEFPLAAPSANPFGYISPTTAQHVAAQLGDKIAYILDGGPCKVGLESTIVGFKNGQTIVYRKGGITVEALEHLVGEIVVQPHSTSNPLAPGMLRSHYAPKAKVVIGDIGELFEQYQNARVGVIRFQTPFVAVDPTQQVILSPIGDFAEAARNFFAGMRYLDSLDLDVILAELLPEQDLGSAINDRLRRAAAIEK